MACLPGSTPTDTRTASGRCSSQRGGIVPVPRGCGTGRVTQRSVDDWLLSNLDVLTDVPGLAIFVQRAGDVVALPHFTIHATVNLQYNVGTKKDEAVGPVFPSVRSNIYDIRSEVPLEPSRRSAIRFRHSAHPVSLVFEAMEADRAQTLE